MSNESTIWGLESYFILFFLNPILVAFLFPCPIVSLYRSFIDFLILTLYYCLSILNY